MALEAADRAVLGGGASRGRLAVEPMFGVAGTPRIGVAAERLCVFEAVSVPLASREEAEGVFEAVRKRFFESF